LKKSRSTPAPPARPDYAKLQVRRPDTALFATLQGLQTVSGVSTTRLRRLALKELADNALDASEAAGRRGAKVEKIDDHSYAIEDYGNGIRGTPEDLAALFALDRPMVSGKFWRLPERGALGNGLRIAVGCVAVSDGVIDITTNNRRTLLRPYRNGRTEIVETSEQDSPTGTRIIVTFGPNLPRDECHDTTWAAHAVAISAEAEPPYDGRPSPHWMDAAQLFDALSYMEPPETTVRQYIEGLDGCSGGKAGKIAAPFGKNRTCRSMGEAETSALLTALQDQSREVKPKALGQIGEFGISIGGSDCDYSRRYGWITCGAREPRATIPFIVEAWVNVRDRSGRGSAAVSFFANRTPIADETVRGTRYHGAKGGAITLSGAGMYKEIDVKPGSCSIVVHITAPFIPISSLGKQPDLRCFQDEIAEAIRLAYNRSRDRCPVEEGGVRLPRPEPKLKPPPFEPSGHLGKHIKVESEAAGLSINDLTVLSASNDPYRFDNAKGHELGRWFANWKLFFVPDPTAVVHLRGLHYMLVAKGDVQKPDGTIYTNTDKNWVWLQSRASKAARWLGYVPFECIKDQRADPPIVFAERPDWDGLPAGRHQIVSGDQVEIPPLLDLLPMITWSRGAPHRQPYRIVFIGEKSSLEDVLYQIAERVKGELFLGTGESSESHVSEIAGRAAADGRPLVILYFSDFDPSGHQMAVSVARKIQAHVDMRFPDLRAELHHVALTLDQVIEYELPSTPLKETEKRAERWREAMEHEQTEIDALAALRPEVLRQIAEDSIRPFFDETLDDRVDDLWGKFEAEADAWFEALPAYAQAKADISKVRAALAEAAQALADAQKRGVEALTQAADEADDAPEPPDDTIEPEITESTPYALFSTDDAFVTASIKLIERKRLVPPEESDEADEDAC
jgi:DNA topoisomerase VI subunit B